MEDRVAPRDGPSVNVITRKGKSCNIIHWLEVSVL